MADIFISYSKAYRPLTESLAKDLQARDHTVWWDTSLLPGDTFRKVILKELDAAKAAIVIWSPASILSDWVIVEADRARAQKKLITVRTADVQPNDIPPPFGVHHSCLMTDRESIYLALAKLGVICPLKEEEENSPGKPKQIKPNPPFILPWRTIGAGALSIVAVALAYTQIPRKAECTDLAWSHVQKTERLSILQSFAEDCKSGRYGELADEDLNRRENRDWDAAKVADNLKLLEDFPKAWPKSVHMEAARARIDDLKRRKKVEDDRRFADDTAWSQTVALNNIAGFQAYLRDWPNGAHVVEANEQIKILQAASDREEQRRAIANKEAEDAKRIAAAEAEKLRKVDDAAWAQAEKTNLITGWNSYLKAFPAGLHINDANDRIAARKRNHVIRTIEAHTSGVVYVAFLPDGNSVLSAGAKTLKLWDVKSGKLIREFSGHTDDINTVVLSSDGKFVLSGSNDKTARFWDVSDGRQILSVTHSMPVTNVYIYLDDSILTGNSDEYYYSTIEGNIKKKFSNSEFFTKSNQISYVYGIYPNKNRYVSASYEKNAPLLEIVHSIELRNLSTKELINEFELPDGVRDVKFLEYNNQIIIFGCKELIGSELVCKKGYAILANFVTGSIVKQFTQISHAVNSVDVEPRA